MPKSKTSAMYTCDLCDFKVANSYIFKRHLHRCLSIHGIASKRSSPRNPIRLKGTEGLLSKEGSLNVVCGVDDSPEDVNIEPELGDLKEKEDRSINEEESFDSPSLTGAWDISGSPKELNESNDKNLISSIEKSPEGEAVLENTFDSDVIMPGAPYNRQYSCNECPFKCNSAREHLYHLRDVHGEMTKIYTCSYCNYASRFNNKVERHMAVHKQSSDTHGEGKSNKQEDNCYPQKETGENVLEIDTPELDAFGRPKLKPLRLKRLNIKMPFKISGSSTKKKSSSKSTKKYFSLDGTPSPNVAAKEVYRMILVEGGTHHYQCRDCLYYASIPSSVKKHHVLCHSKLLCCPHCDMTTRSQGIYYEHIFTHDCHGYMKCNDCSYVTHAKSNFEKHRSFHTDGYPVKCTVCNFGAESESKIKRHVATQHTPAIIEEPSGEDSLAYEEGVDHSYEGVSQDESYDTSKDNSSFMDDSQQNVSTSEENSKNQNDGEDNTEYRCPKCPMVCYRRGNFTRHLTAKHKFNQANAASLSKSMENQIMRVLKKKSGPLISAAKQKKIFNLEVLKCSHCSYIAKWPSDLRRHMQVHTIVKRFKCTMCSSKYKYLGDLNVHMRRDHNMEPPENLIREMTSLNVIKKASPIVFRCPICPFTTHSKAELEQHSRIHGDIDKTYQCRLCDYQTYWRGDVGRHLFRHHKIVLSKDALEIGEYLIHRPDIKPLTKQTGSGSSRHRSLSPSPSPSKIANTPDKQDSPDTWRESTPDSVQSSTSNSKKSTGSVTLKDGTFVCEYPNCEFKTTTSERMEAHMAVHLNLKQYVCPTCGKRTNWKWDIVKHLNKVHMNPAAGVEDVITLTVDEARATIQEYLSKHDRKNKELAVNFCSLCEFKSLEKNRVIRHMAMVHKNENGRVIGQVMLDSPEVQDSLAQSRESEKLSGDLSVNCDSGSEQMPLAKFVDPSPDELAKIDKPYACAICGKSGSNKGDVKKHYNYTHPYKDVRVVYVGDGTEFNYYTGEIYPCSSRPDLQAESPELKGGFPVAVSPTGKLHRPDSKFSNPKMHGYVKPFKCSICGLRSNWKWDLKKHLRSKHPNEGGFVIMLSIEEASQTYGKDCSPSHPKNEDFLSIPKTTVGPVKPPSNSSSNSMDQFIFKQPPNIKAEILADSNDEDSQDMDSNKSSFFPQSPSSLSQKNKDDKEKRSAIDPTRRQWKCSGCNYITNWRRNMARHIHRKHPLEEGKIKVLPLHKSASAKTLVKSTDKSVDGSENDMDDSSFDGSDLLEKEAADRRSEPRDWKLWRCSLCPYKSKLRTHIIGHMQLHGQKPFLCGVCEMPFMNRGPLHRHLQKVHKRADYLKMTKLNIFLNKPAEKTEGHYIDSYFCTICQTESECKDEIIKHLQKAHDTSDMDNVLKIQKYVNATSSPPKFDNVKTNRKSHFCKVCPYRTQKKSMLAFHMTYHKPNPANRFKCKHCPYYVSTLRLLHQHQRKWHKDPCNKITRDQLEPTSPPASPHKPHMGHTHISPTPRRHYCEKCPYTTNSKNDFIYHKQFHRPKRTAEYKCEYCDYWVVHKRLLKQHMRLHTIGYSHSPASLSIDGSPTKSIYSDPGLVYDPVELTELALIKQKMIAAKITASLAKSPSVSPMKIETVEDKPGYVNKNGLYRKLHRCRFCPYTNTRSRNMQLHEMMHGPRDSIHSLTKCPYCDYHVGSKGLLSHHIKVHQNNNGEAPENDNGGEMEDDSDQDSIQQQKVDTLLQISRFKRFGCERCPYASAKRQHFERHLELHGSRQRYTCQYCDYSVPSSNLLLQHTKLHMMPNQNLLASQSITNLQHLSEVPADVALASALPPTDTDATVTISVIHDHLGLYENSIYDTEPKKLYRCDRCPYANVRRDYLLSHLKFHMVPSALVCPYCDYSAPKQPLLSQHIRVHFCPLPELSDWLLENGQTERETSQRHIDLAEALKVAHEYQNQSKKRGKAAGTSIEKDASKDGKSEGKENIQVSSNGSGSSLTFICQYCDREFLASEKLVKHELQHLIGNHFEREAYICRNILMVDQATVQVLSAQQAQQQQLIQSVESSSADPSQEKPEGRVVIKGKNRAHGSKGKKSRAKFQGKVLKNSVECKDTLPEKQEVKTGEVLEPSPNVAESKEGCSKQETCGQMGDVDIKSTEEKQAGVGGNTIVSSSHSDIEKTAGVKAPDTEDVLKIHKVLDVHEPKENMDECNPSNTSNNSTGKKKLYDDGDKEIVDTCLDKNKTFGSLDNKDEFDEVSLLESDPEVKETKAGDVEMMAEEKAKLLKTDDDDDDETEIESPVMETTVAE
ncbi:uncharacterized protein LOC131945881 isoform X2 [Physella acuta]|uniref:uncharacterized protein LOC131945881 isoform X2 n=1 Tax=Physella acuta TaxID=109671 RepID=UPI0027DBB305|nr:uncharacterized protein LOC131945881 isoform X2 [Physella acuta]